LVLIKTRAVITDRMSRGLERQGDEKRRVRDIGDKLKKSVIVDPGVRTGGKGGARMGRMEFWFPPLPPWDY
jgi:hypothetical protein